MACCGGSTTSAVRSESTCPDAHFRTSHRPHHCPHALRQVVEPPASDVDNKASLDTQVQILHQPHRPPSPPATTRPRRALGSRQPLPLSWARVDLEGLRSSVVIIGLLVWDSHGHRASGLQKASRGVHIRAAAPVRRADISWIPRPPRPPSQYHPSATGRSLDPPRPPAPYRRTTDHQQR